MLARRGDAGAMTIGACLGRRLIEEHRVAVDNSLQSVARGASHILVPPLQGKSSLLVIEQRRLPFVWVMTFRALRAAGPELIRMRILVTITAIDRGFGEFHLAHRQFHLWRFMTVDTPHRAMRSRQREVGLCMIELCQIIPPLSRMARLTSESFA